MPYTSYGLLKAVRSHTISNPSVTETVELGRPNACSLCHLDQTLGWTGEHLSEWYGAPQPELSEEVRTVAAALLWVMKGDAGERALAAWNFGWQPAQEASGTSWMVPHLADLLNDPYEAVRSIAYDSLRRIPGYVDVEYDYLGDQNQRVDMVVPVLQAWRSSTLARQRRDPQLLVDADGVLRVDVVRTLFDQRDQRTLFLRE